MGARISLGHQDEAGDRTVPVLAFTLIPNLAFREPGGELTSALVAVLLAHGFQLSMSADYGDIVRQAADVNGTCHCALSEQGLVTLRVDGETLYSRQLDPANCDDGLWLAEARTGGVLVISGDNLDITQAGLHMDAAARLRTLVTGKVPVRT